MYKVLFVCLGNICRSPAADGVFHQMIQKNNMSDKVFIDSAGTCANHIGENADGRMQSHAEERGYKLPSIARQFVVGDLKEFDLILAMDESNYSNILALDTNNEFKNKVKMFTDYCQIHNVTDVPDPYWGAIDGFNLVMDIIEDGCAEMLNELKEKLF